MGTKISGFYKTLRGRGSSPTRFIFGLRAIQMVEIVGAGTAVHFSPKDLGLDARFSGLFSNSLKMNFRDCFLTIRTEIMDCFQVVRS